MARSTGIARAADFVTVACKLPTGLRIHVDGLTQPVHLHGTHSPFARFGYGMTEVKADVWAQIQKQHGEHEGIGRNGEKCLIPAAAWLTNKVVFAASQPKSVNSQAKELEKLKTGFEAVDPMKPSEVPGASNIQRGDDDTDVGLHGMQ
jgi:hypothetical protein